MPEPSSSSSSSSEFEVAGESERFRLGGVKRSTMGIEGTGDEIWTGLACTMVGMYGAAVTWYLFIAIIAVLRRAQ